LSEDIILENDSLADMTVHNNDYAIFYDIDSEDVSNNLNIETSISLFIYNIYK